MGTSGPVFRGLYDSLPVAVKTLHINDASQKVIQRILTEVALARGLHHPNIVITLGVLVDDNCIHMVSELCSHGSLTAVLAKKDNQVMLTPQRRLRLALECCQGIEFLHGANVLHSDVKPDNFLVSGENMTVKVADFGSSKVH